MDTKPKTGRSEIIESLVLRIQKSLPILDKIINILQGG